MVLLCGNAAKYSSSTFHHTSCLSPLYVRGVFFISGCFLHCAAATRREFRIQVTAYCATIDLLIFVLFLLAHSASAGSGT